MEFSNDFSEFSIKIGVIGVGGAGSNSVERLSEEGITGADLIAINTDSNHLRSLKGNIKKVLIGGAITGGFGSGGDPLTGEKAANYSMDDIKKAVSGYDIAFLTAGMGGGTGTGASYLVAQEAKKSSDIVIGVVTTPFKIEKVRSDVANKGIRKLVNYVDTLIVIDNQKVLEAYKDLPLNDAFKLADSIISRAVKGITNTINEPGLINIDYADIKSIFNTGGLAMISIGYGEGQYKIDDVVKSALSNKLIDVNYDNARGAIINITGGDKLSIGDVNEIVGRLTKHMSDDTNVIFGAKIDPKFQDKVEAIVIFTGVDGSSIFGKEDTRNHTNDHTNDLGLYEI